MTVTLKYCRDCREIIHPFHEFINNEHIIHNSEHCECGRELVDYTAELDNPNYEGDR